MLVCLQLKNGVIHIIEFTIRSMHYTTCDLIISKRDKFNIFGLDGAVKNMCSKCVSYYSGQVSCQWKYEARSSFSIHRRLIRDYQYHADDISGEASRVYTKILSQRYWNKLRRYKSKLER